MKTNRRNLVRILAVSALAGLTLVSHYAALRTDRTDLNRYLAELAAVDEAQFKRWPEAQRLALLINASRRTSRGPT
jgi:hypothetical protein